MAYTQHDCIVALNVAKDRLGRPPTQNEYDDMDLSPSSTTICRRFDRWNDAIRAADQEPHDQGFKSRNPVRPVPDHVDMEHEEWESLTAFQRDYYEHKEKYVKKRQNRVRENRKFITELKAETGCTRCDEDYPQCLHFHHTSPDEKSDGISSMVKQGYSREKILAEIEKCELLCANCHIKEHHE